MSRRFVTGFALALSWPSAARADPIERGALRLDWSAPGGCPNGVEVLERIEVLLGTRIADSSFEPISARGTVRGVQALRFELELETRQRDQRFARSMQAPSCTELTDAGALVLALAIDPTLAERKAREAEAKPPETAPLPTEPPELPKAEPAPPALKPTAPAPPRDSARPRDDRSRDRNRPHSVPEWSARIGLLADVGTVADVAFGPRATVSAGWNALRAELGFVWLPPARTFTTDNPDRGGDIDLVAGELAGCLLPFRGVFEFEACAGVEVGRLHGAGFGTVSETEGSATWFGAGGTLLERLEATESLGVVASVGFLVIPQDTEFTLKNVGPVHQVPRVVGRFGVSVETEFE